MKYALALALLFSSSSFATELVYISRDGTLYRHEKIGRIDVLHDKAPTVGIYAGRMACSIEMSSVEEAYKLQEQVIAKKVDMVQCFGDQITSPNGKDSLYLSTSRYSVGTQID